MRERAGGVLVLAGLFRRLRAACDHRSGRVQTDLRGLGFNATLDDARQRTVNRVRRARGLSAADIDRHNPWRAPGAAPVADACRLAGGTPWGADAPEEGKYVNTSFARHGDRGSVALGPLPGRPRVAARGPQHGPYGP